MRTMILRALLILATVVCSLGAPVHSQAAMPSQVLPPDPQPLPRTGDCIIDNIFYGVVPPGGSVAPVLVFVHGLAGLASDWWSDQTYAGLNEMYARAHDAGYRTAFVNLNVDDNTPANCAVERRPANDNYVNGAVLAQQLDAITEHYAVDQVDIIAHSKGGIDSQTAIVWSGAWSKVRSLFTLGTPHQGSILVDQLWSPEGAWLAGLLGQLDGATYAMQTVEMQQFRAATDPMTIDDDVAYYSGAGNFWDVQGLPILRLTGNWLQNHPDGGDNDAVVTVASTYLPGATPLFLEPWSHIELYMGQNSFSRIQPYLPVEVNAPTSVTISGPGFGTVGRDYVFTATTQPDFATTPLTYTWRVTDLATLEVVGAISDSRNLRWQRPGWKAIQTTVANSGGTISTTQYIYIFPVNSQIQTLYLPLAFGGAVRSSSPRLPAPEVGTVRLGAPVATEGSAAGALIQIARGGLLRGPVAESIPVEPQAESASVMLLASDESVTASLRAPDGVIYPLEAVPPNGEVPFEGAAAWLAEFAKPQPGDWQLLVDGPDGAGYYALVTLDSSLEIVLEGFPATAVSPGQSLHLHAVVRDGRVAATGQNLSRVDAITLTTIEPSRGYDVEERDEASSPGNELDYRMGTSSGARGATVRIVGETGDGYRFERTYSRSLMVAEDN